MGNPQSKGNSKPSKSQTIKTLQNRLACYAQQINVEQTKRKEQSQTITVLNQEKQILIEEKESLSKELQELKDKIKGLVDI